MLDLAVRGRLVEQDPTDDPVSELLLRIEQQRSGTKQAKKVQKSKLEPVSFSDELHDLPAAWDWVALASISEITMGQSPPGTTYNKTGDGVPLINGPVEFSPGPFGRTVVNQYTTDPKKFCEEGDLLLCVRGSTTGRTNIAATHACIGRGVAAIRSMFDDSYIRLFLWRSREEIIGMGRGVAFPSISKKQLETLAVPLPPLAEQHRIVAKVNDLMALLDRLETTRTQRETTRNHLTTASLTRLTAPETTEADFPTHARFALDNLDQLTSRPDQIKVLRQTILNLAVRGKLVEQDPADRPLPPIDEALPLDTEAAFEIPKAWQWSRLRSLGDLKGGGTPSKARDDFWNGHVPWVSPKDMKVDYIGTAQLGITEAAIAGSAVNLIEPESVLFVVRGMILAHSFPVAISKVPLTINQDMKAIILKKPVIAEYLLRALKGLTPEILTQVQRSSHGTCRIEGSDYGDFLIPLPPLSEQHRIVKKVDALISLCDRIETSVHAANVSRAGLLETLLQGSLEVPYKERHVA